MSFFSGLQEYSTGIIERLTAAQESRHRRNEGRLHISRRREYLEQWERPQRLPAAVETVFLSQFRSKKQSRSKNLDYFSRQRKRPLTIDDAWNRLTLKEREYYAAKAKENEIYNTSELAKFNERCPLEPSMNFKCMFISLQETLEIDELPDGPSHWSRVRALQSWKMYRSDHPHACGGGSKTPVPETPFRILDLPIELRREIFSLVLSRSRPVRQFPPDGSADVSEPEGPVDVRLFAVSRQVFVEAVKVFYEVNTFRISTEPSEYYNDIPLFVRQSTGNEAPRPTDSIKRVHISFWYIFRHDTKKDEFLFLWKRFCDFLRTCRGLQKFEVIVQGDTERLEVTDPAIRPLRDEVVEILMTARSSDEFDFSDVTSGAGDFLGVPMCRRTRKITGTMI